jgi:pimeloyl-ACP methyl ester carboxylesterase
MKKIMLFVAGTALILYVIAIGVLYFIQERLIFFPQKLSRDYRFAFDGPFEERWFPMKDGVRLHGLYFPASSSRGLIFYLHGNAGSLASWGDIAGVYTALGYDLFMLDYRGYGKSEGSIRSEGQLHQDIRAVYDSMKAGYREEDVTILGYSIGTGPAAKLAAESNAGRLILQTPYYSMAEVMATFYPLVPRIILRYRLETHKYLHQCRMPVVLFHGDRDQVIPYESSVRLKALLKPGDTLITLKGQGHIGVTEHPEYRRALAEIMGR